MLRCALDSSNPVGSAHVPEKISEPTAPVVADDRIDPPFLDPDRPALEAWLELYRHTLPIKVGGLTAEQLCRRSVPPSTLSLLGIVRHLTKVEHYWFGTIAAGRPAPMLYAENDPDGDFNEVGPATAFRDLEAYRAQLPVSREQAAAVDDLDRPLSGLRHGERLNLRWVYLHLIEEYARHLGHFDLLREAIDGTTGY
jgi:hypothetical protein